MGMLFIYVANLLSDTFKLYTEYIRNEKKIFHLFFLKIKHGLFLFLPYKLSKL